MHRTAAALVTFCLASAFAGANPVDGEYSDLPQCDNHGSLLALEELGELPLFPQDELIQTVWMFTNQIACPMTDDPTIPNVLVDMRNLSGRSWQDLFYVADPETSLSNLDGEAMSYAAIGIHTPAFRIDALGMNKNLVSETFTANHVFEPGEAWQFIIQDYANSAGVPPSFGSLDFAGASAGDATSSGSIVQFVVPAPASMALLGLAAFPLARRR
ncbi:MAG TPA: PEP-CTERM sorting domain-containing protein [Phycisphaerales bacterium]|nr:PEP-CTERM sorting domain-containing protein [Phycisphaerales bacterium]